MGFSSSKCSLFHNSNVFGSCIIHILYTGCAKIKKNNSSVKRIRGVCKVPLYVAGLENQAVKFWSTINYLIVWVTKSNVIQNTLLH